MLGLGVVQGRHSIQVHRPLHLGNISTPRGIFWPVMGEVAGTSSPPVLQDLVWGTSVLLLGTGFRGPPHPIRHSWGAGDSSPPRSQQSGGWRMGRQKRVSGHSGRVQSLRSLSPQPQFLLCKMGFTEQTRLLPRVHTLRPESIVPTLNLHTSPKPGRHRLGERGEEERGEDGEAGGRSWCRA